MATRPIFIAETVGPAKVRVKSVAFTWHAGLAKSRKQMSMRSLHEAARALYPQAKILEVSRMSDDTLGEQLSAFNLTFRPDDRDWDVPVECAFQASKVFERGGPFPELLNATPIDAKRDPRLRGSGRLIRFQFLGEDWPSEPPTAFYDWIYINALQRRPQLAEAALGYDTFTDIAFNPEKSINCQASAVALYVGLVRQKKLRAVLECREAFLQVEANATVKDDEVGIQGSLF